jgi:hypothetical protein
MAYLAALDARSVDVTMPRHFTIDSNTILTVMCFLFIFLCKFLSLKDIELRRIELIDINTNGQY